MVVTPQTSSPLVWDFVAIMSYLAATLCFLYLPLIPDLALVRDRFKNGGGWRARLAGALAVNWQGLPEQRRLLNRAITTVAIIIIPLAVVVHSVLSWAFAVTTRPGWSSTIFGPYFVVAALYSGVAMVILVVAGFRAAYRLQDYIGLEHFRRLAFMMLALDLLYLYFTFTEMLTEGYARTEETAPVLEAVLIGRYAPFFWLFFIGAGVAPLLTIALPRTRTLPGIIIASSLVVVGMWLKRVLIIVPAVANPLIQGAWGNFNLTWVAVAVTLGGAAAIPLMLMMFFKCVPILAVDEIEEVAAETAESDHPMAQPQVALHAGGARK
jgi:molybdopterin-containing oxidoreductase family membrane subunit